MWPIIQVLCLLFVATSHGQQKLVSPKEFENLRISERIGNFSVEILNYASNAVPNENLVLAPMTMWTALAVIAEGADNNTLLQIKNATRYWGRKSVVREDFRKIAQFLTRNASTVVLANINAIFIDTDTTLEKDFQIIARDYYQSSVIPLNFADRIRASGNVNDFVSKFTHGRIPKLVEPEYFDDSKMILISGVYFKGQWSSPFNVSSTEKRPFYDSKGKQIGEVNMMYNRFNYPFANMKELSARVIEIPYGVENRLSMLVMLPNHDTTLEDLFIKLNSVPLDKVFAELKISQQQYQDDEVDCYIPRFKIESNIKLNNIFMNMGIKDLFDPIAASLPFLARTQLYVSKVMHKAEIEVTEEGTTGSAITSVEFANRIGIVRFEANRPFAYIVVEKVTNSIVFGGLYRQPVLY